MFLDAFTIYLQSAYDKTSEGFGYVRGYRKTLVDKTHDKTKTKALKGKGEGKRKGIYIMYKYIIFFGVMFGVWGQRG